MQSSLVIDVMEICSGHGHWYGHSLREDFFNSKFSPGICHGDILWEKRDGDSVMEVYHQQTWLNAEIGLLRQQKNGMFLLQDEK